MTALVGQDQPTAQAQQHARYRATGQAKPRTDSASSGEKADRIRRRHRPRLPRKSRPRPIPGHQAPSLRCRRARPHEGRDGSKPKSPFLASPDGSPDDRYGPDGAVDWSDIPPWRQTSFFGIRARGQFFVYVVDCSGSMIDDDRMPRATIELRRSVLALREPQRFEVIFYNSESIPMPGGPIPRSADHAGEEPVALVPPN